MYTNEMRKTKTDGADQHEKTPKWISFGGLELLPLNLIWCTYVVPHATWSFFFSFHLSIMTAYTYERCIVRLNQR